MIPRDLCRPKKRLKHSINAQRHLYESTQSQSFWGEKLKSTLNCLLGSQNTEVVQGWAGLGAQVPLRSAIELDTKGRVCTGYFGKGITKSGLVRVCGCLSIIFLTDIRSHYFNNAALNIYPTEPKYPVIVNVQRLQQREIVLLLHFKYFL